MRSVADTPVGSVIESIAPTLEDAAPDPFNEPPFTDVALELVDNTRPSAACGTLLVAVPKPIKSIADIPVGSIVASVATPLENATPGQFTRSLVAVLLVEPVDPDG